MKKNISLIISYIYYTFIKNYFPCFLIHSIIFSYLYIQNISNYYLQWIFGISSLIYFCTIFFMRENTRFLLSLGSLFPFCSIISSIFYNNIINNDIFLFIDHYKKYIFIYNGLFIITIISFIKVVCDILKKYICSKGQSYRISENIEHITPNIFLECITYFSLLVTILNNIFIFLLPIYLLLLFFIFIVSPQTAIRSGLFFLFFDTYMLYTDKQRTMLLIPRLLIFIPKEKLTHNNIEKTFDSNKIIIISYIYEDIKIIGRSSWKQIQNNRN